MGRSVNISDEGSEKNFLQSFKTENTSFKQETVVNGIKYTSPNSENPKESVDQNFFQCISKITISSEDNIEFHSNELKELFEDAVILSFEDKEAFGDRITELTKPEELDLATKEGRLGLIHENEDGSLNIKAQGSIFSQIQSAKSITCRSSKNDGTTSKTFTNFTTSELSEHEIAHLHTVVKVYYVYLQTFSQMTAEKSSDHEHDTTIMQQPSYIEVHKKISVIVIEFNEDEINKKFNKEKIIIIFDLFTNSMAIKQSDEEKAEKERILKENERLHDEIITLDTKIESEKKESIKKGIKADCITNEILKNKFYEKIDFVVKVTLKKSYREHEITYFITNKNKL